MYQYHSDNIYINKNFYLIYTIARYQNIRNQVRHRFALFPDFFVNPVSHGTFHFKFLQSTKTPIGFVDKRSVKFYFVSYRKHRSDANRCWQCRVVWRRPERERGGSSIPNRVCELRGGLGCGAHREKEKYNGGSWHVSRLSVFTEIPCTLRPVTFVTDYSTKVSHRARAWAETYPDKLHRTNRQCSQMEPEARARLFKQQASRALADLTLKRLNLSLRVSCLSRRGPI